MSRPVVITGIGPITCFGLGIAPLWEAMMAGRSGIGAMTRFDAKGFPCRAAGELAEDAFSIRKIVPKSYRKATKVMCRDIELAVGAATMAVESAGMVTKGTNPDDEPSYAPGRFGCHIGAGLISADVNELTDALITSQSEDGSFDLDHWGGAGMQNLTPLWLLKYLPNMLACHVTIVHDCQGPSNTITCCEASGMLSLGESMRIIDRGAADCCLTGGAEYKLNLMAFYRQWCTGRLAETPEGSDPTAIVKPFDPEARGTLLGEGGGLLILEAAETATARGASVLARVSGYGCTQSFCPDTIGLELDESDESVADALSLALHQAGLEPDAIDAIVPFGSGIPSSDRAEAAAIKSVFGDRAETIPLITTVPFTGNCNAGNGAVALCTGTQALVTQTLPARLNTTTAEGLDAAACDSRSADLKNILVFTTSQGGQNAAVILSKP